MSSDFAPHGMTSGGHAPAAEATLANRVAGQAVMEKLLSQRVGLPPRSFLARTFGANPLTAEDRSWYTGVLGEVAVGEMLRQLGPQWAVFHAVPVGDGASDIDHVLVGPGGVFTLNTKHHPGQSVWVGGQTLMVAGRKQRHLYNSAHEAARAGRLLSTQVRTVVGVAGIVVILGAKGLTIKTPPTGTTVMTARQLLPWLARRPVVLGPRQITALSAVAARPETWRRTTSNLVDPGFVRYEFAKLRAAVESARRRRIGWVLGLFLGGPVVVNTLFYAFPLLVRF